MIIKEVIVSKIFNSRSDFTIKAQIITKKGNTVSCSAPSGASTGKNEVNMYKNNNIDSSINYFKKINLSGMKFNKLKDLELIEKKILKNNTINSVGGNLIIAVEYAIMKAWAIDHKRDVYELFYPFFKKKKVNILPLSNIIGGGAHSGGNSTDYQEFLISTESNSFEKSLINNIECYKKVKIALLKIDSNFSGSKTDEGAWAPTITNYESLNVIKKVISILHKKNKLKINVGLDVAASQFFKKQNKDDYYQYKKYENLPPYNKTKGNKNKLLSRDQHIEYMLHLSHEFHLFYLEDPVNELDSEGYNMMKHHSHSLICGDDLICTNLKLLKKYYKNINAVIIKPNQVGSILKTIEVVKFAKEKRLKIIVSHRSGETNDDILADIAWGLQADYFKCGDTTGERIVKLNRLIEIEKRF